MRSTWRGHIRFSLVTIPIQIYSAVESKSQISFNQIHKEDMGRVSYRKVCRTCQETLSSKDIVKGYQYAPDQYIILEPQELEAIKLKSTRAIDIEAFVDIGEVHPSRFEAVYYVGPHGEVAQKTFGLFTEVLKRSKKAGIGRIILRDREDVVLIKAEDKGMIMYKLRYPNEIRDIENVPDYKTVDVDDAQVALAETLVASLSKSFSEVDFEDRYKEALDELVQEKIDGKQIINITEQEDKVPVVDIMDALKASIEQAKAMKKGA